MTFRANLFVHKETLFSSCIFFNHVKFIYQVPTLPTHIYVIVYLYRKNKIEKHKDWYIHGILTRIYNPKYTLSIKKV